MASQTRTLPAANSVNNGDTIRVQNSEQNTTLTVQAFAGDWIHFVGNVDATISPLEAQNFVSDGVLGWRTFAASVIPLTELFDGAPLVDVTGVTQIVLTRNATNLWANSFFFTVAAGDLVAIRPCQVNFGLSAVYESVIANNQDAGLQLNDVIRAGTGNTGMAAVGGIFQSSRGGTFALSLFSRGTAFLDEGDVLGFDASDYAGQLGQTDMTSFSLRFDTFG